MAICSYLVIPRPGESDALCQHLGAIPGCEVTPAVNHDLLVLVTDTPDRDEENRLRERIERLDGIQALVLTFGEVDPS
jgi:nitrate reductase NapAB chaperone NapD